MLRLVLTTSLDRTLKVVCCPSLPPIMLLKVTWFLLINNILCSHPKSSQECICCLDQLWIPISASHLQLKKCVWKFTQTLLFPVGTCISNYFLPDENTLPLKGSCFTVDDLRSGMICICCIYGTEGIRKTNVKPQLKKKDKKQKDAVSCQRKQNQIWIKEKLLKASKIESGIESNAYMGGKVSNWPLTILFNKQHLELYHNLQSRRAQDHTNVAFPATTIVCFLQ